MKILVKYFFFIVCFSFVNNSYSNDDETTNVILDHKFGIFNTLFVGSGISFVKYESQGDIHYLGDIPSTKLDVGDKIIQMYRLHDTKNFLIYNDRKEIVAMHLHVDEKNKEFPFYKFKSLKYLSISSKASDVSIDISLNTKLEEVYIGNGIFNKIKLPSDSQIKILSFIDGNASELVGLENQNNLKYLRVDNSVRNLKALNGNASINSLVIVNNKSGSDGLDVSSLESLNYLYISNYSKKALENIDKLKSLKSLNVYNMDVDDVTIPESIELFVLSGENVSSIPKFLKSNKTKELIILHSSIKRIDELPNLDGLKTLTIKYSPVTEVFGIERLTNLEKLTISFSKLDSLPHLNNMDKLKFIDFSHNNIELINFKDIERLKSCEIIKFNFNQIETINFEEITLKKGCKVSLVGNKIFDDADYDLEVKLLNLNDFGSIDFPK